MAVFPNSCLPACLLVLTFFQLSRPDSAPFDVIGPAEPVLAALGDDAELPCHLSPSVSAERMELRWFRGKVAAAVLVRRDGREREAEQTAEYRGRATLLDGDIAAGRVAVRIHRVRASDDGEYRCLFRQDGRYGEASVHLKVAALGSDPQIHMEVQESGEIRLECTSVGWYPEPQVQWRTSEGEWFPSTSESRNPDEEGLFTVAASVIIRDTSMKNISCHFQNLLLGQEKEVEISIPAPFFPRLTPWMVAVAVILMVLGLLTIGSVFGTWRLYRERARQRKDEFSSKEKLLEELKQKKATLHAVDVTLDPDTAHPHLFLYEDSKSVRLEDSRQKLPEKPERFDSWPCVLGRETFTSGRHFWEVEVGDRADWAVGVCRENVVKKGFDPMTPQNGFWAVELYGNGYWALTPQRTPLPLAGPPRRVGIFLDYESGDVSFYNMANGAHIYSFSNASFSGPLRPFFCLWSCGKKPLTICPPTDGPERVTVVVDAKDFAKEIPLSPMGEDSAPGDTDTLHSKLIPTQPSQGAP
ncbi:butyrophilin subfamily 1 member A1 isoform X1 [Prionailurus bengalensis]|uniref:butyrophilin subfamily 1 member A1 isoform X1 n=1 Tax=Prionailurus bengalensis TaxID=37029 RepID=UPI001CA96C64|nr:butyrophilin subfamily 1 member A1 isoform X1 [Prionailurus bengalensis]XP_043448797.1 butyrophilin subfamily 1 member A1 isoform X1 [Prionailurus bengalensis]